MPFPISPTWPTDVPLATNTVGDEALSRVAARELCWLALRAVAGVDLVHRVEHRHSRGRLEFVGEDGRFRRLPVVPLLEECQANREMLLCEERRRCDFRGLLFHSQTIIVHSSHETRADQARRMLLAEETCQN